MLSVSKELRNVPCQKLRVHLLVGGTAAKTPHPHLLGSWPVAVVVRHCSELLVASSPARACLSASPGPSLEPPELILTHI